MARPYGGLVFTSAEQYDHLSHRGAGGEAFWPQAITRGSQFNFDGGATWPSRALAAACSEETASEALP